MNKFYTLSLSAVMLLASADAALFAQSRKTWDFTQGYSDVTKANLNADANWVSNRTDATTGETTGWKDGTKMSGTLTANGEVISELEGLVFGTAGLSSSSNYLLDPTSIRMSRANMVVNLPKLANGQQVTIEAKSANSSDSRGITANTDVLVKEAGPDGDVAPGSEGHQTWVWHVETDSEDSVAVSFKILNGGVDIYLIQIDNGDEGDMDEVTKVAYLFDGSVEGYDAESDPIYAYTAISEKDVTKFDLANYNATEKSLADSLETFGVVVYSEHITGATPNVDLLYTELNRVPVLNLNASLYEVWGQGSVVTPNPAQINFTLSEEATEHDIFADCDLDGQDYNFFLDPEVTELGNTVLGYQLAEGSDFADDEVLATVGEANAIHLHGKKNTYMLLPYQSGTLMSEDEDPLFDTSIFGGALDYLAGTKSKVLTASAPTITCDYADGKTTVTLATGLEGGRIYYTTDGTEPTTASARYSEPLVFTEDGQVSAIVVAPAYNQSNVKTQEVVVKTQLAQPTYSIKVEDGVANVSLAAAEGKVYYNITASTDTLKSSLYVDSIGLQIVRPTILSVFAAAENKLPSDRLEFVVDLEDKAYYNDTLVHLTFQEDEWTPGTNLVAQTPYFSEEIDQTIITPNEETGVNDTTYTYVPAGELYEVNTVEGWKVQSYGQRILVQKTGVSNNVMASYGPADALDAGATGNALSFLQAGASGDPATAALVSTTTYAAPFALGVHFTGQAESGDGKLNGTYREALEVSVSTDSINWTVVDTLATNYMKLMSYQTVEVAGEGQYYVKVASANPAKTSNKQKTMIFDLRIYGASAERPTTGIIDVVANQAAKTVKAVQMYNMAGQRVRVAKQGVNVIRTIYTDGTVSTKKVIVK
jgi:hypothetical protein